MSTANRKAVSNEIETHPFLTVFAEGGLLDFGLTELFFETSEPPNAEVRIDSVLARLSEGEYAFTLEMVEAGDISATTPFAHRIPAGPNLLTPADGSTGVDPNNVVVAWGAVSKDIMASGAPYNYEVLAIAESGNQTLTTAAFARM
jgi:hypothetical protein